MPFFLFFCIFFFFSSRRRHTRSLRDWSSDVCSSDLASLPMTDWGAGYVAANGQLLISGGLGDGNITNAGFSYDPGTDSWSPLPNSNNAAFRLGDRKSVV